MTLIRHIPDARSYEHVASTPSTDSAKERYYRPELDWLRFLAFVAVFVHHAFPNELNSLSMHFPRWLAELLVGIVRAGGFGVDLFFVLSAFLITELLLREYRRFGHIDLLSFFVRRSLRIWPLYFLFLFLAWCMFRPALTGTPLLYFALFLGNWYCAWRGYPNSAASPLWSVSIEEQFYLAWPIILTFGGLKRLPLLFVGFIVTSFLCRAYLVAAGTPHPGIWCNTFARLDPIACGIAIAFYQPTLPVLSIKSRGALFVCGVAGLIVCGSLDALSGSGALIVYPLVSIACSMLLIAFLGIRLPRFLQKGILLKALAYLGKISYGLYVFHLLALRTADDYLADGFSHIFVAFLLTVVMAMLSYELIEAPFLRLKRKFTRIPSRPV